MLQVVGVPDRKYGEELCAWIIPREGSEPTAEEIRAFCTTKFGTTFPLFAKISVKGEGIHPLYRYLTTLPGLEGDVTWNFNKFLVDPSGRVVARFGSKVDPMSDELTTKLEGVLPKGT